jgi:hypothetical protein
MWAEEVIAEHDQKGGYLSPDKIAHKTLLQSQDEAYATFDTLLFEQ